MMKFEKGERVYDTAFPWIKGTYEGQPKWAPGHYESDRHLVKTDEGEVICAYGSRLAKEVTQDAK